MVTNVFCYAAPTVEEESLVWVDVEDRIVVQNGKVSKAEDGIMTLSEDGTAIALTISSADRKEDTLRQIDAEEWNFNLSEENQLAVADYILENYLGYTVEAIEDMSPTMRIDIGYGPMTSIHTYAVEDENGNQLRLSETAYAQLAETFEDSKEGSSDGYDYTLNITEKTSSTGVISYHVSNTGFLTSVGLQQYLTVSAQNCAVDDSTATMSGSYYMDGNKKTLFGSSTSSNHEYAADGSYSGVRFKLGIPACNMTGVITSKMDATASVKIVNSSVQPGAGFNVYGNLGAAQLSSSISFSLPFGVSISDAFISNYNLRILTKFA